MKCFGYRTILKVGNQINDGERNMGSLLKLNTSKAFDKKTSVLQYVITLLFRNDLDALLLTEDLKSVVEVNSHTTKRLNSAAYIHTCIYVYILHRSFPSIYRTGLSFYSGFHQY